LKSPKSQIRVASSPALLLLTRTVVLFGCIEFW
jgi:hypothetical protein